MVTFTEEILKGKFHFLYSVSFDKNHRDIITSKNEEKNYKENHRGNKKA